MSTVVALVMLTSWARSGYVSHILVPADKCEMLRKIDVMHQDFRKPFAIWKARCEYDKVVVR